jgi:hypothetical protein
MAAQIEVDEISGVVRGGGEIDLSSADELRDAIAAVLRSDSTRTIVIDLSDVTFITRWRKELIRPNMMGTQVLRRPSEPAQRAGSCQGCTDRLHRGRLTHWFHSTCRPSARARTTRTLRTRHPSASRRQ